MAAGEGGSGQGRLVTIEGPEGAGKTTQAARLAAWLASEGREVVRCREPGGTPLGERLRDLLLAAPDAPTIRPIADALLFNAARAQLVDDVIRPALARGSVVVCARYADSTLAYQGFGLGLPVDELRRIAAFATGDLSPDLTILLDLPVEVGLARKHPDDATRFETAYDLGFHRRVRAGFLELASQEPHRFRVVDAGRAEDEVLADVIAAVSAVTGLGEPGLPPVRIPG